MTALGATQDVNRWHRAQDFARRHPLFILGSMMVIIVILCAILAPLIAPFEPSKINFRDKLVPPGADHFFGTDALGRDIFSRIIYGTRTSLLIGFSVLAVSIAIGLPIGLVAGYYGGKVDHLLMRVSDVFLAFPPLLLPIAITAALGAGLFNAMIAIAISWFPWYARIVRGAVMRVRSELFIDAAKAMGVSDFRVMVRHALPNSLTPVIVQASMDFGYTILAAASLSFIGIGAKPPAVEWGLMVAMSRSKFLDYWWTAGFPGLAIFVTVLAVNLVGDGVRDILDPRYKGHA